MSRRSKSLTGMAAFVAVALSGCSTPQHTNLLIFGTNTVVGLKAGADATQTPAIQLAYARQELVLMPLLANTAASRSGGDLLMAPCPAQSAAQARGHVQAGPELTKNCKFLGTVGDEQDSYSVMASFGAKFDATRSDGTQKGSGAIAQYFATGLAARELARHGASLVAASESATQEAQSAAIYASPERRAAILDAERGVANREAKRQSFRNAVADKIAASADFTNRLKTIDGDLGLNPGDGFVKGCAAAVSATACADGIRSGLVGGDLTADEWETALAAVLK